MSIIEGYIDIFPIDGIILVKGTALLHESKLRNTEFNRETKDVRVKVQYVLIKTDKKQNEKVPRIQQPQKFSAYGSGKIKESGASYFPIFECDHRVITINYKKLRFIVVGCIQDDMAFTLVIKEDSDNISKFSFGLVVGRYDGQSILKVNSKYLMETPKPMKASEELKPMIKQEKLKEWPIYIKRLKFVDDKYVTARPHEDDFEHFKLRHNEPLTEDSHVLFISKFKTETYDDTESIKYWIQSLKDESTFFISESSKSFCLYSQFYYPGFKKPRPLLFIIQSENPKYLRMIDRLQVLIELEFNRNGWTGFITEAFRHDAHKIIRQYYPYLGSINALLSFEY